MKASLIFQSLVGLVMAVPAADSADALVARQSVVTGKYCSPITQLCYNEYTTQGGSTFRVAVSDAAAGTTFDIAVQLLAPAGQGWVGLSFGGSMTYAPLAVGWPNGQSVTGTVRWANGHTMPTVYSGATLKILPDSGTNGTHYMLSAICTGCSSFPRSGSGTKTLNPSGTFRAAWAQNIQRGSVAQPANPASNFNYHQYFNYFDADLGSAKVPAAQFQAAAALA
ncbi:uncharacterized protein DNG_08291 [Cephalotrichum gorgonifer]|uniref:Cellobiose dehydrogenase-like cytochrome domain-containing protein n=1 Tax=Cephalotrichum gorgonifer TaxID=2041049 RepID=A0AAE8N4S8_9PEZI|nr:uncharacterized protein DNG_08291 [Cephalotrichum gorgonifer]